MIGRQATEKERTHGGVLKDMDLVIDDDYCWLSFWRTGRLFLEFVTVGENDAGEVGGGDTDLSFANLINVADLFLQQ